MSDDVARGPAVAWAPPATAGAADGRLYYFTANGATAGPATLDDLAASAAAGRLGRDDLVWADGDAHSAAAWQVPALAHLYPPAFGQPLNYLTPPRPTTAYATFWQRVAAYILDGIIVAVANGLITAVFGGVIAVASSGTPGGRRNATGIVLQSVSSLAGLAASWLYYALFNSSTARATPGKMALGIVVVDEQGGRISFGRATGRHFALYLSMFTLLIGFLMVLWTERRQALHDKIAGTLVVTKTGV